MSTTPAARIRAKTAMASATTYISELVLKLRQDGILESRPEIAAMADEAKYQVADLWRACVNL